MRVKIESWTGSESIPVKDEEIKSLDELYYNIVLISKDKKTFPNGCIFPTRSIIELKKSFLTLFK